VLADQSGRHPPAEWARLAISLYRQPIADRIVRRSQQRRRNGRSYGRGVLPILSHSSASFHLL
jgi:phage terminase large subunit-like protein